MASSVQQIFTINDFPSELIERFAPDLWPRTISTLRLVCRRFRDVFTSDQYYRRYLCYPDRPELYRRDLEELGDEGGRWRRCLEREKQRLANWRKGEPTMIKTVEFPDSIKDRFEPCITGIIDNNGEHWILRHTWDMKVILLNVTKEPLWILRDMRSYEIPHYTGMYFDFEIALGQVVMNGVDFSCVLNYFKHIDSVSLDYYFKIEGMKTNKLVISGTSNIVHGQRNLLVNYDETVTHDSKGLLRVWDLKKKAELESIVLGEFSPFGLYFRSGQPCSLGLIKGAFPNVLVVAFSEYSSDELRYGNVVAKNCVAAIVNVEKRQMTNYFGSIENLNLSSSFFNSSYAGLCTYEYNTVSRVFKLYDLRKQSPLNEFTGPQIVFQFQQDMLMKPMTVCLVENTILIKNLSDKELHEISFDGPEIVQRQVEIPDIITNGASTCDHAFVVGPFRIFATSHTNLLAVKRYHVSDRYGNELFEWKAKFQKYNLYPEVYWEFNTIEVFRRDVNVQTLFVCTIQNHVGDLVIFHF